MYLQGGEVWEVWKVIEGHSITSEEEGGERRMVKKPAVRVRWEWIWCYRMERCPG